MKHAARHPVITVLVLALLVNLGAGAVFGFRKPLVSDAHYYLHIAQNLVAGKGYIVVESFWPEAPSMSRLPLWPVTMAMGLKLFPGANPDMVGRILCLLINALAGAGIAWLTLLLLKRRPWAGILAGVLYVFHPGILYLALSGLSEPLFILLVVFGLNLLLRSWPAEPGDSAGQTQALCARILGFLYLGLACLVRANFVLFPAFLGVVWLIYILMNRAWAEIRLRGLIWMGVCLLAFSLPVGIWIFRNYRVSGQFPVISTLRGQTFYGGNNDLVANTWKWWGYWVFPNAIPGETPMMELADFMSEVEVDAYYTQRGKAWIRSHIAGLPQLVLGKLTRAYVPVPWKLSPGSGAVSAYRWMIYFLTIAGVVRLFRQWRNGEFKMFGTLLLWPALFLCNLAAVLVFWGNARFALAFEPFLLPMAGAWIATRKPLYEGDSNER